MRPPTHEKKRKTVDESLKSKLFEEKIHTVHKRWTWSGGACLNDFLPACVNRIKNCIFGILSLRAIDWYVYESKKIGACLESLGTPFLGHFYKILNISSDP